MYRVDVVQFVLSSSQSVSTGAKPGPGLTPGPGPGSLGPDVGQTALPPLQSLHAAHAGHAGPLPAQAVQVEDLLLRQVLLQLLLLVLLGVETVERHPHEAGNIVLNIEKVSLCEKGVEKALGHLAAPLVL